MGEALNILVEHVRHALRPYPSRPLHVRTIEGGYFLHTRRDFLVDICSREVAQNQHRGGSVPAHDCLDLFQQEQNLLALAVTEVDHKDHVPLVLDEPEPLFTCATDSVVRIHESNPSTTS